MARQRAAPPTGPERRAQENRACVGGLRRPVAAVRRLPFLAAAGKRLRAAIEQAIRGQDGADLTQLFGLKPESKEGRERFAVHECLKERVRESILAAFEGYASQRPLEPAPYTIWQPELMARFARAAHDPDRDLVGWLVDGAPAGVALPVRDGGVFPKVAPQDVPEDLFDETVRSTEPGSNYSSVEEEPSWSAWS